MKETSDYPTGRRVGGRRSRKPRWASRASGGQRRTCAWVEHGPVVKRLGQSSGGMKRGPRILLPRPLLQATTVGNVGNVGNVGKRVDPLLPPLRSDDV